MLFSCLDKTLFAAFGEQLCYEQNVSENRNDRAVVIWGLPFAYDQDSGKKEKEKRTNKECIS